jgi:hypothetical protein
MRAGSRSVTRETRSSISGSPTASRSRHSPWLSPAATRHGPVAPAAAAHSSGSIPGWAASRAEMAAASWRANGQRSRSAAWKRALPGSGGWPARSPGIEVGVASSGSTQVSPRA